MGERFTKMVPETPNGTPVIVLGWVTGHTKTMDNFTGARNAMVSVVDAAGTGIWTAEIPEACLIQGGINALGSETPLERGLQQQTEGQQRGEAIRKAATRA